jgi:hypothetical protein
MVELVLYAIAFVIGGLAYHLVYGKYDSLEVVVFKTLKEGKRVIISFGDECLIYEMHGNKVRVTRGMTYFSEDPYGLEPTNLGSGDSVQSNNVIKFDPNNP